MSGKAGTGFSAEMRPSSRAVSTDVESTLVFGLPHILAANRIHFA
jgi:hypothetical protein